MTSLGLSEKFIIFDLEWTAWEGSQTRQWSRPDEYREIFDIGAVKVAGEQFDVESEFHRFIQLDIVPKLPDYSVQLTGITQQDLDEQGVPFAQALHDFAVFCAGLPVYCWGSDNKVIAENCELKKIQNPFREDQFHNIKDVFKNYGIPADNYMSSTIVEHFGQKNRRTTHQGIADALNIVDALRLLQNQLDVPRP